MSNRKEYATVTESTSRQNFTVENPGSSLTVNENVVNVKTLERCLNEKVDRETGNIVDLVEDKFQSAILTVIDSNIAPNFKLAVRLKNASSGRGASSVMPNLERGEHVGTSALFENVSERNKTLHVFKTGDETPNNNPDKVNELSVTGTHFDQQSHTHQALGTQMYVLQHQAYFFGPSFEKNMNCLSFQ